MESQSILKRPDILAGLPLTFLQDHYRRWKVSKKFNETDHPLFLISPPGSTEAKDIGYINIPKIVSEPPSELSEVQAFTDETGFLYSTQKSNAWVLKSFIEKKKASFDEVIPLFPQFLKYSLPWILCEYAYHCIEENDDLGFKNFVFNTLNYRYPDYGKVAEFIFYEKNWPDASKPISYIKKILKNRTEWREKEKFTNENRLKREWRDNKGFFHIKPQNIIGSHRYLSFDKPMVTGNIVEALAGGTNQSLTLEQSIFNQGGIKHKVPGRLDTVVTSKDEIVERLIDEIDMKERPSLLEKVQRACKAANISEKTTRVLLYHLDNVISIRGASYKLGYSDSDYESIKKEIQRKRHLFKKEHIF